MFRILIVFYLILAPEFIWGQNLIKNSSFEEITECADEFAQIEKLKYWNDAGGTIDVFSECSLDLVPEPPSGPFQYASFEFGQTYIYAAISYPFSERNDTIFREFVQGETLAALNENSYYFSLHANTNRENRTNHLGVYFSEEDVGFIGSFPKGIEPQLEFDEWIGGYDEWKKHEGCIRGIEGSNFLIIGNFHEPGKDEVEFADVEVSSAIFIDNLVLKEIPTLIDTSIIIYNKGDCIELSPFINEIPVKYYVDENEIVGNQVCPSDNMDIEQRISSCNDVLRNIKIEVLDCNCNLYAPNIIYSSSTNFLNSQFSLGYDESCIRGDVELHLYNRWGELIYLESSNNFRPEDFNPDVYFYTLRYNCKGESLLKSGNFTLTK